MTTPASPPPDPATPDLARLRTLANAATPGPWERGGSHGLSFSEATQTDFPVWEAGHVGDGLRRIACWIKTRTTADFIAACDPATVLALIDAAERTGAAVRLHAEVARDYCILFDEATEIRAERDRLAAEVAGLTAALQRTLSWLSSYPGGGPMAPGGPYEQARGALAALAALDIASGPDRPTTTGDLK